jgi:hypothetical protein
MNELEKTILKYEKELDDLIVMDDYDGGKASKLREVISDLRKLVTTKFSKGWYEKEVSGKIRWKTTTKKGGRK